MQIRLQYSNLHQNQYYVVDADLPTIFFYHTASIFDGQLYVFYVILVIYNIYVFYK